MHRDLPASGFMNSDPKFCVAVVANRRSRRARVLLGFLGATCVARAGLSRDEPRVFVERVQVNLVNVEVVVTDSSGKPVAGLNREDFDVREDDRPMVVSHFYRVEGARSSEPSAPSTSPAREEAGFTALVPEDQRLHLVIYVDNRNLEPGNRNRVFEQLHEFLRTSLGPSDRVAIATFDGSVKIRRPFTDNAELASLDFFDLDKDTGRRVQAEAERRSLLREMEQTAPEQIGGDVPEVRELLERVRHYARSAHQETVATLTALRQFVDSLGGISGRKAVLYLSDGLSMQPGKIMLDAFENKFSGFARQLNLGSMHFEGNLDATENFRDVVTHANANRVTFYTIDASGPQRGFAASAEDVGSVDIRSLNTPGGGRVWTSEIATAHEQGVRSGFGYLAGSTGGLTLVRSPTLLLRLKQVAGDFALSYSLGYTPPHEGDGRFHKIEVKVRGRGLSVRHREGYRDKTADERATDRTLSALLLDVSDNRFGMRLEPGRERSGGKGTYLLPVMVKIPMTELALIPEAAFHRGQISVFVAVRDAEGRVSEVQKHQVPVRVPREKLAAVLKQVAGHVLTLSMRPGLHTIAVGVRDDIAATTSTVQLNVKVGNE